MTNSIVQTLMAFLLSLGGCSFDSCNKAIESESEASQALQEFFTSNSTASRNLIDALRKDGMTDDRLKRLQAGCRGCDVFSGQENLQTYDKRYWYVSVSIAPVEEKKSVVLEIQCPSVVRLHLTLHGG